MAKFYLSSSFLDLHECRTQITNTLRRMGHEVIGMENYMADGRAPLKKCLDDVAQCDAYIGIFAWRYGYIPTEKNPKRKAITELEYREALKLNKEPLIFILSEDAAWPGNRFAEDEEERRQIKALRQELSKSHVACFFKDAGDLANQASITVALRFPAGTTSTPTTTPPAVASDTDRPHTRLWKWYALAIVLFVAVGLVVAREVKRIYGPAPEPGEYPTERIYDFHLTEKGNLQERWSFPQGQWDLEKGEGEDKNDAALLVKSAEMGIPNDLGDLVFKNYRAEFKVRFKEGNKATWVLRAQRDRQSGYVFELKKAGGSLFLNGWILKQNQVVGSIAADKDALRFSNCCEPSDGLRILATLFGNQITYDIRVENTEDTLNSGRSDRVVFRDVTNTFKWGSIGLFMRGDLTTPKTDSGIMEVEFVRLSPLPVDPNASESPTGGSAR